MRAVASTLVLMVVLSGCGDGNGSDGPDLAAWLGLAVGDSWAYRVDETLEGTVEVVKVDPEYLDGVESLKVEFRVGGFVQVTRWYQVDDGGLFLLGEEAQEGGSVVARTFQTRIALIPYPLEFPGGGLKQSWTTESRLEEGGSENHRFDNLGLETIEVPAGSFEAYHLVHTRVDTDGLNHQYNLYFTPENWLPRFDYPESTGWKLE